MPTEIKHFGTSGEIVTLIEEVNAWLEADNVEIVAMSESQGGRLADETDPFYYSLNIAYRRVEGKT